MNIPLRILTFNIRLSWGEVGQPDEWKHRKDFCADILRDGAFDFAGLQEATWTKDRPELHQVHDLQTALPEYGFLGRSRAADPENGEAAIVLYRKDRWEPDPAEQGVFWLSETPNVPASMSWDTACTRNIAWALFHEHENGRRTGRSVVFASTHLDHVLEHTQLMQAMVVDEFLASRRARGESVILTGDFNAYEYSWPMLYLCGKNIQVRDSVLPTAPLPLRDAWRETHPDAADSKTFHGWGNRWTPDHRIDYILYAGDDLQAVDASVDTVTRDGRFPSDHYPVSAVFSA